MFTIRTGLIIPTRNRPKNLYFTLRYLKINKINFFKIIVVDSSDNNLRIEIKTICNKFNVELYFSKPSTSQQRNLGLEKLMSNKLEYIMFLDDDLKFYKNSFKSMDSNIKKYVINSCINISRYIKCYETFKNKILPAIPSLTYLTKLNSKTKNEVTKIKINEVTNLLVELGKNDKVSNDNIVNLLQYCDLLEELKSANGK
jgi:glycosyltransferase involved in cell wall biosynthesis